MLISFREDFGKAIVVFLWLQDHIAFCRDSTVNDQS